MREVVDAGADLGIAWDGDADRCFFIDEQGAFVDGDFLTALLAESMLEKQPGATILYDVRASRAVADVGRGRRRARADEPRRPRVLQDPDARGARDLRRRGVRPLLLPRLLLRGLRDDPGAADARAAVVARRQAVRAARALPLALLHLRGDQLGGRRPRRPRSRSSPRATPTRASTGSTGCRSSTTTGTSTCGPRTPSRCCGCASSRCARARTWSAAATRCSP